MDVLKHCVLTFLLAVLVDAGDLEGTSPNYNPFVYFERPGRDDYLETYYPRYGYKPYSTYSPDQDCMCTQEVSFFINVTLMIQIMFFKFKVLLAKEYIILIIIFTTVTKILGQGGYLCIIYTSLYLLK